MRILVTGGAGFIGSHVVERLLRDGHEAVVIDDFNTYYNPAIKRANVAAFSHVVPIIEGDIRVQADVESAFAKGPFDAIIHLAARAGVRPSILEPELYLDTNIKGTFHLLEAARTHQVPHFVFASSSSVYGVNEKIPFAESDALPRTISPYAMTKLAGEHLCANYSHLHGLRTVCLRFFTVYGPRQRPDLAISKFTKLMEADKPIPRFGDGSTCRDYTYIDDIVEGVMGAIHYTQEPFAVFNLGGSQTVTLNDLIETIATAVGKTARIEEFPPQPGDVPRTVADVSLARKHLGFEPKTCIKDGVPLFVEWYRSINKQIES